MAPALMIAAALAFLCSGCQRAHEANQPQSAPEIAKPSARAWLIYDAKLIPAERVLYWRQETARIFGEPPEGVLAGPVDAHPMNEDEAGFFVDLNEEGKKRLLSQEKSPREFGTLYIYIMEPQEPADGSGGDAPAGSAGPSSIQPMFKDPTLPWPCEMNADCVAALPTCCGCTQGGAPEAAHRERVEARAWTAADNCDEIFCPQMMSNNVACFSEPVCKNGFCAMAPDPQMVCRNERYAAFCRAVGDDKTPEEQRKELGIACKELNALCKR